jgi:hypothetical protein
MVTSNAGNWPGVGRETTAKPCTLAKPLSADMRVITVQSDRMNRLFARRHEVVMHLVGDRLRWISAQ